MSFVSHISIFYYKNYLYSFFPTPETYGHVTPLIGGTLARGYLLFLAGLANSIGAYLESRDEFQVAFEVGFREHAGLTPIRTGDGAGFPMLLNRTV